MSVPSRLPRETIVKGATFQPVYELRDADGTLIDLTHVSVTNVFYRLLTNAAGAEVVVRKKSDGVESLEVTSAGRITPKFSAATTAAFEGDAAAIEILVEISGVRTYYAVGQLTLDDPDTGIQA